jgi:cobalt-zinc-cadmium efflux system membrane fusion protein
VKMTWAVVLALLAVLGCSRTPQAAEEESERSYAVTLWSDKTELFMEYPALVAGQTHRFAVHFTDLRNFRPQTDGSVQVELRAADGQTESYTAAAPSRPGIFGVDVSPRKPGKFSMSVVLNAPGVQDRHEVGEVAVHATAAEAQRAPEQEEVEATKFLKEQQWNLDFATRVVEERKMRESITVPGEVRPRAGGESELTAPVDGRFTVANSVTLGASVHRGQPLGLVLPSMASMPNRAELESVLTTARAELQLARKARERAERLLAVRAIPAKQLDEARAAEETAEAKHRLAETNLAQMESLRNSAGDAPASASFTVRSPISGVIAEVAATPGSTVQAGQRLYRVVATDAVHVLASVPEGEAEHVRRIVAGELVLAPDKPPIQLGRPLSAGRVIDPATRTIAILFQLPNSNGAVAVGQVVSVRLFTSVAKSASTVPESAIVEDAGQPVVFVQVGGESFARRAVQPGGRESGFVEVTGLKPGERVVTQGAYLIRLAALSGQVPTHGHVH